MRCFRLLVSLLVVGLVAGSLTAAERLTLGSLFTDHAVLQRDMPVTVWGQAEPEAKISVQFAGQEKQATADKSGRWLVKLDPLATADKGQTLMVKAGEETLKREDILVGEVWVCSGQSNMGWTLRQSVGGEEAAVAAGDQGLRLFNASARAVDEPQTARGQSIAP